MWKKDESAQWVSMSDMMTGLMLIFLLIAVAFMYQVQLKQKDKEKILVEYNESNLQLYKELKSSFSDKEKVWWMKINPDLEIKFNKEDINFETDSFIIPENFKNILKDFIPKYLEIINNKKYNDKIKEIKILGHTWECLDFEYEECLILSQRRANSVLIYLQNTDAFKKLKQEEKDKLNFWFTANWMWDWKLLDKNWEYIYFTKNKKDDKKSRRVEFKIITNSDSVIKNIINKK